MDLSYVRSSRGLLESPGVLSPQSADRRLLYIVLGLVVFFDFSENCPAIWGTSAASQRSVCAVLIDAISG